MRLKGGLGSQEGRCLSVENARHLFEAPAAPERRRSFSRGQHRKPPRLPGAFGGA